MKTHARSYIYWWYYMYVTSSLKWTKWEEFCFLSLFSYQNMCFLFWCLNLLTPCAISNVYQLPPLIIWPTCCLPYLYIYKYCLITFNLVLHHSMIELYNLFLFYNRYCIFSHSIASWNPVDTKQRNMIHWPWPSDKVNNDL